MSKIFKVSTVTRIAGVLVTILVNVTDFVVADVKRSQVPPVTERVGILITVSVTVTIFNVANLKCANAHKDGMCPSYHPKIVIVFDVADPPSA